MRDIKKAGLTMPIKQLGPILRKVLIPRFKDLGFELIEALENFVLVLEDKKSFHPERGLGLGMGNNIWTLIQVVMFDILAHKVDFEVDGLFGNDDSAIFIFGEGEELENRLTTFIDEDQLLCKSLGIEQNYKKMFTSTDLVFYEEYTRTKFIRKESRFDSNLGTIRLSNSIFEAKVLVNSLISSIGLVPQSVNEVINFFGYEFFPSEYKLDFRLGGWYTKRSHGLSLALREVYESEYDTNILYGMVEACSIDWTVSPEPGYDLDQDDRPFCRDRIELKRMLPKGIKSAFLFMTRSELVKFFNKAEVYSRNLRIKLNRLSKTRQKVFNTYRKRSITPKQLSEVVKSKYNDLAIPRQEVPRFTRQYDVDLDKTSNPDNCRERSIHDELCQLHDNGYIEYNDRYKYKDMNTRSFISNIGLKIKPDKLYKEYREYCDNPYALLGEWYLTQGICELDNHPKIPEFVNEEEPENYKDIDTLDLYKSNVIIPIKSLYITLGSLHAAKVVNELLLEYQSTWLLEQYGLTPLKMEREQKLCDEHLMRDHKEITEVRQLVDKNIPLYHEHIETCEMCRKELSMSQTYKILMDFERKSKEEKDNDAQFLIDTSNAIGEEEEYNPNFENDEDIGEDEIVEEVVEEDIDDDLEEYNDDEGYE